MKIKITKGGSNALQKAFGVPLDFEQRVEMEKLLIMESILARMDVLKMKRKDLAGAMKVSSARITAMLDGKNNFTLETLMRAAEALDCEFQSCLKPKATSPGGIAAGTSVQHYDFTARSTETKRDETGFSVETVAENDNVDAA